MRPGVVFFLLAGLATPSASQSAGRLRVRVIDDAAGRPLAVATVQLPDVSRSGTTDVDGVHLFTDLPPGPQHLSVRRLGYVPSVLHVFVGSTGTLELTVVLRALPARLVAVRVESPRQVPLRDDDALHAIVGERALTRAAIIASPLLAEPDALLAVGGGYVTARPESPGGLHVMGGASDQLAYRIDGLPMRSPYHAGGAFGGVNVDMLDRVELQVAPAASATDALSGVLSLHTRPAPATTQWTGGMSVTQARLMMERPLARVGSGLLLSGRLLFPGLVGQKREPANLDGDGNDLVARVMIPWQGGTLRVLAYQTASDVALASRVPDVVGGGPIVENDFSWSSRTMGAQWEGAESRKPRALALWRTSTSASSAWHPDTLPLSYRGSFSELGVEGVIGQNGDHSEWSLRGQVLRRHSTHVASRSHVTNDLGANAWLVTLQPHGSLVFGRTSLTAGANTWLRAESVEPAPFVQWAWRPSPALAMSAEVSRRVQFTQSLRNPESMAALLFPADLSVVASDVVPPARSNQFVAAATWRPGAARRVALRTWWRQLSGLALPAIGTDAPFALADVAEGSGSARGASLDLTASGSRWGVTASYGVQRVRLTARDTTWQPEHGISHSADAGIIVFPAPSASVRLGATAGAGRRVTGFGGPFEWESCNLRDRGCEFAGTPSRGSSPLGGLTLPRWVRVDLGARKHWHWRAGQRDVLVAAHATWSNILDRRNVLTYTRDGVSASRQAVVMRPSAPLVIGFDWTLQ